MNKHTPGPWGRIVELGCDVYAISKDPESHTFVAECASEGDAIFIAAAPAMYEALTIALQIMIDKRVPYQHEIDQAQAALAQAEGK